MDGDCIVCNVKTSHKCSRCYKVFYCSKDHQKEHWKKHKSECFPFSIKEDEILGRHLVATKDIKVGEIILKEKPLVIGPAQITAPVCLGCYKIVNGKTSKPCEKCGWPVCSSSCQDSPNHVPECELTAARGQKVHIQTFECVHPSYQPITALRCLYTKKTNLNVWKKLMALESHCEIRKTRPKWDTDLIQIAQFAKKFFNLNDFTEDDIMKICGTIQVNGHEVPFSDPPFVAIFEMASMLEHNCKANCNKSFTERGEILIIAAVDIKPGENISISYTDPLWGTINRRHHLNEANFFLCSCERCKDVTEFKSMISALKCQKEGCLDYMLPKTFLTVEEDQNFPEWICNACENVMKGEAARKLIEHVGKDLQAMEKGKVDTCLKFLSHYGRFLHPMHFYMVDVSMALAQLIGQETENGLAGVSGELLAMKVDLCQKISDFLENLAPAETRARGMLLFELHAAIAETGRRRATESGEGPPVLIEYIVESKKYLEKSINLLKNESNLMTEGKVAIQAVKNLTDIDALLSKLCASLDCPL